MILFGIPILVIVVGIITIFNYYDPDKNDMEMNVKLVFIGIGIIASFILLVVNLIRAM